MGLTDLTSIGPDVSKRSDRTCVRQTLRDHP
jgi:hypothetical protein